MPDEFGPPPDLDHLDHSGRRFVIHLRERVAPILANNLLPHFTDHSVQHSDHVTQLLDDLLRPMQATDHRLRPRELIILYSASYLHDIGLQLQTVAQTAVIQELQLDLPWEDLNEPRQRELLRKHHHRISAELVHQSPLTKEPLIGLQLSGEYEPSQIACLCEAHNLHLEAPADRERYDQLTNDGPNLRMGLLSALLRTADILDESRRRATREKARTLSLPLEAQSHWWRHYYTESVTFDPSLRTIWIWFDFPPDRLSEYESVVPALQLPSIKAELQRHTGVFAKYGLVWALSSKAPSKPYSSSEAMPDDVMAHMLAQLRRQHLSAETKQRESALRAYKEARPHINRRLEELRAAEADMKPSDYLLKTSRIADELWNIGSKRTAVSALASVYTANAHHLPPERRLEVGTCLLEMLLQDGMLELAAPWLVQLRNQALEESSGHPCVLQCLSLAAEWLTRRGAYDEAVEAIAQAMRRSRDPNQIAQLEARLAELHFVQGNLRAAANNPPSDGSDHA